MEVILPLWTPDIRFRRGLHAIGSANDRWFRLQARIHCVVEIGYVPALAVTCSTARVCICAQMQEFCQGCSFRLIQPSGCLAEYYNYVLGLCVWFHIVDL